MEVRRLVESRMASKKRLLNDLIRSFPDDSDSLDEDVEIRERTMVVVRRWSPRGVPAVLVGLESGPVDTVKWTVVVVGL